MRDVVDGKPMWNSSRPAQCPYCLVFIKQARNMNRHIKYYCQIAGAPGKHYLRPQVELRVEEPTENNYELLIPQTEIKEDPENTTEQK